MGIDGKPAQVTTTTMPEEIGGKVNAVVAAPSHPFVKPTLDVVVQMDIRTAPTRPVLHSYERCLFWESGLWRMF
jgi:hypothetical protein